MIKRTRTIRIKTVPIAKPKRTFVLFQAMSCGVNSVSYAFAAQFKRYHLTTKLNKGDHLFYSSGDELATTTARTLCNQVHAINLSTEVQFLTFDELPSLEPMICKSCYIEGTAISAAIETYDKKKQEARLNKMKDEEATKEAIDSDGFWTGD
jgi:hypothetical protein